MMTQGGGLTYCFNAVGVSVTPITKGPLAQILFGWQVFFFPRSFSFDFLDFWPQGQALKAFLV